MSPEIGTAEAAALLGIHESKVAKLATVVNPSSGPAVRAALARRRLPGRKVSRAWLFRPEHVLRFAQVERPAGRPARSKEAPAA